jgi:hypothetical protein
VKRTFCAGAVLATSIVCSACGTSYSSSNPGPALPSPVIAQVNGMWRGSTTLVGVTGGECVGSTLAPTVGGVANSTLAMSQEGTTVTAELASAETGLACRYSGRVALNTLTLHATACSDDPVDIVVQCTNGSTRQLELIGSTINATVLGGVVAGTVAETFNVRDSEDTPVAGLVLNRTISATRR